MLMRKWPGFSWIPAFAGMTGFTVVEGLEREQIPALAGMTEFTVVEGLEREQIPTFVGMTKSTTVARFQSK